MPASVGPGVLSLSRVRSKDAAAAGEGDRAKPDGQIRRQANMPKIRSPFTDLQYRDLATHARCFPLQSRHGHLVNLQSAVESSCPQHLITVGAAGDYHVHPWREQACSQPAPHSLPPIPPCGY